MIRRRFVTALAAGVLPAAAARAQTRAEPRQIGLLSANLPTDPRLEGFFGRIRSLGYVEGRTIVIHGRYAGGQLDRLPELARELVALKVEVIVAIAAVATVAARGATDTIPIVMVHAGNPIGSGLIRSLARPGGNVTGTTSMLSDLPGKQLELLRKLVPSARRIAVLANPTNVDFLPTMANAREAAPSLGLELALFEVVRAEDIEPTLAQIAAVRADAMLVAADPLFLNFRGKVLDFAARTRLPTLYALPFMAHDGGLISLAPNFAVQYPRAADYVDKILRGANPAELPVEQPTTIELMINLRTARALGLEIPPTILSLADETIE